MRCKTCFSYGDIQMLQTTIYLSVYRGGNTLTLDGNLDLFRELLATLSATPREQDNPALADTLSAEDPKPEPMEAHAITA